MQRFMKKDSGFVVEAAKVGDSDINELANWAHAYVVEEKDALTHEVFEALNVRTPEGTKRASHGMYVIKVEGHIFVSQPGAFEDKYVPYKEPDLPDQIKNPEPPPLPEELKGDIHSRNSGSKRI